MSAVFGFRFLKNCAASYNRVKRTPHKYLTLRPVLTVNDRIYNIMFLINSFLICLAAHIVEGNKALPSACPFTSKKLKYFCRLYASNAASLSFLNFGTM